MMTDSSKTANSLGSHRFHFKPTLDDPSRWLGSAELLDLEDSKLRLRAKALTQLCKNEREKALAIYGFVKRIPFSKPLKLRLRTARQVIDADCGDAGDKVVLLIALLRAAAIPARLRVIELRGAVLRGLTFSGSSAVLPVAEIWLSEGWRRTDTYIFDAAYMAAARRRLIERDWEWGYGIHRNGHTIWDGTKDAFLGGSSMQKNSMALRDFGVYNDPLELICSPAWRRGRAYPRMVRVVQWNVLAPIINRVARELREEATCGDGARVS